MFIYDQSGRDSIAGTMHQLDWWLPVEWYWVNLRSWHAGTVLLSDGPVLL